MTKLEMATKILLKLIETDKTGFDAEGIAAYSFEIADAMQAEADKRSDMERPAVLQDEWQPDWSVSPDWADCWSVNCMDGNAYWFSSVNDSYEKAPLFGYDGHWVGSFRKKPWGF